MDANVKIEPFWRVVRFKQQYWIQLFAENGAYRTLTKTTRKPVRIGDYLLVQASAGKCMTVVYLDEKQDEAVPLFIAEQVDVCGGFIRIVRNGRVFFWEPSMRGWSHRTPERCMLDCGAGMQTYVAAKEAKGFADICRSPKVGRILARAGRAVLPLKAKQLFCKKFTENKTFCRKLKTR